MKINKLIAPIIITILLVLYLGTYLWGWSQVPLPPIPKVLGLVIPLGLMGVSIYVLIERIKEIRSGEEDDLSKYWLYHGEDFWNVGYG